MSTLLRQDKEYYTEAEATEALGVSKERLNLLLIENVFNDGSKRPDQLTFRPTDLILIEFWNRTMGDSKVVRMPKR